MKRILLIIGILIQFAITPVAQASSLTFGDSVNFWPTWPSIDVNQNSMDVIGHPDVIGGTVTLGPGHTLSEITFKNVGNSWSDLYVTDLFINVQSSASDTTWDYIVRGGVNGAGDYDVFNITGVGLSSIKGVNPLSYYIITAENSDGRHDHPVEVSQDLLNSRFKGNPYGISRIGTAHFDGFLADGFNTAYHFDNSTVNLGDYGFIIGWGEMCANDVVYEQLPVPEPGTIILLGAGLLGLGLYGRRRMQK